MLSQKPVNRELLNFNHRIPVIRSSIGPLNKFSLISIFSVGKASPQSTSSGLGRRKPVLYWPLVASWCVSLCLCL